jgi:DNA-binding PucR family transcriptional regulator
VPVDGDYLVATGDDLDTARLEHALGSRPNVWVRRSGGAVGLVALGADGPAAVLTALAADPERAIGVSVVVEGLAGVDTGFRQAALALRTLGDRAGVASFDDRLPEALLLTSPEVAGRLVAVWLGPLLALPSAEGGPLLDTLTAWVDAGGSTTHTALAVHCHRNTVINRLRRVGDLTGHVLLDGVPPLELALAVRCLAIGRHR